MDQNEIMACGPILEISTEDGENYNFFPVTSGSVEFQVKCANDAHIALTEKPDDEGFIVMVIFGCSKNTKSVIRRAGANKNEVEVQTPGIVSANEFRGFWIRWAKDIISAGCEGETTALLTWKDPKPFPIAYVGVSTGWGSSGIWKIEDLPEFKTPDTRDTPQFKFQPVPAGSLEFEFRGPHNAHVALTPRPAEAAIMYEVILGGWENTKSVIRHGRQKPDKVEVNTPNLFNPEQFKKIGIEWKRGLVKVRNWKNEVFMEWQDKSSLLPIWHFGVRTAWGASGTWRISTITTPIPTVEIYTPEDKEYIFFPVTSGSVEFQVKCANDAHIALTEKPDDEGFIVEVIFGRWENTKSVIWRDRDNANGVEVQTPGIVNGNEFRGFWIRWAKGVISAGREGETTALLTWKDFKPFPIAYVGVCTDGGSSGIWKIEDLPVFKTPDKLQYKFRPVLAGSLEFEFRGPHNAHVALTPRPVEAAIMYEVILGGWGNTKSAIQYGRNHEENKVEVNTPNFFNPKKFKKIGIEWKRGLVKVRNEKDEVFMEWQDKSLSTSSPISHFGVRTVRGATGLWRISTIPCYLPSSSK